MPDLVLAVSFSDPAFLRYETPRVLATLSPGSHPVEVGVFEFPKPDKPGELIRRAAVMSLGDTSSVRQWRPIRVEGRPFFFGVDAGTGLAYDSAAYDDLVTTIEASDEEVFQTVIDDVVAPIRAPVEVAGIAFDCGMGDGGYPVYVGADASGRARPGAGRDRRLRVRTCARLGSLAHGQQQPGQGGAERGRAEQV